MIVPDYLSFNQIPFEYDPNAKCDKFLKFIADITENDSQLIALLQEIVGYCLTAETRAEKGFYFYGSGSNGKSLLTKIITELVGKMNISNESINGMSRRFGLQSLIGKTVNISAENELKDGKAVNTENMKALISGDNVTIDIKHKEPIEYKPICKLIFLVNSLPNTTDVTHGYFRKILIVPFNKKFEGTNKDVNLFEKIKANEMPGILNWALEGLKRLKDNNYQFTESNAVNKLMDKYQKDQNPVISFVEDMIVADEENKISKKELINKYYTWVRQQGIDDKNSTSNQKFWKMLEAALNKLNIHIEEKKVRGIRHLKGIRLNSDLLAELCRVEIEFDL
ncbi:DNA primase family protein [Clostridium butyricum]|uniref:DNA primase family protein n=1 Tax=Clostridium butyricum TaxID=1492 RepID=UPI00374E738F